MENTNKIDLDKDTNNKIEVDKYWDELDDNGFPKNEGFFDEENIVDNDIDNNQLKEDTVSKNTVVDDGTTISQNNIPDESITKPLENTEDGINRKEFKVNFNDREITLSDDEIPNALNRGFNAIAKLEELSAYSKHIDIIGNDISIEDLIAIRDLKNGKHSAISYFEKLVGNDGSTKEDYFDDYFDDRTENKKKEEYKPVLEEENRDPVSSYFDDFASKNPTGANKVLSIYNGLPSSVQRELYNQEVFPYFINSVISGEWETISDEALKIHLISGSPFIQAYGSALNNKQSKTTENTNNITTDNNEQNEKLNNAIVSGKESFYTQSTNNEEDEYSKYWDIPLDELKEMVN